MSEELNLVRDLAVILIAAGVFTIISKALKQPLILGYILAGILIGPYISFFPGISSQASVEQWSEIGVIFMMFTLGLEFSIKKLMKVGSSALITAGCKFIGVFILGYMIGMSLSWTAMESIFLAGLLSMSSTAVVIKAYDDMKLKEKPYAPLVFGTLVVEDLIAILLMVLLSTMAVSKKFAGGEMLANLGKLIFFLIFWFLIGIYVIPTLLKKAKNFINDEILLLVSIGLCFGMVTLATAAGFSSALGAFLMGSILAATVESDHISKLIAGIKDLFSAIFFVSVGMMVNPGVIAEYWGTILLLTITVMVSHILFVAIGGILTGKGLQDSIHTGFSLAQLGEFGFIIAGVGCTLGVMRDFIYPVIISVSVITTFTTPYMIKLSDRAAALAIDKLPQRWIELINRTQAAASNGQSSAEKREWKNLITVNIMRCVLYGVILIAIIIGSRIYLTPLLAGIADSWSATARSWTCIAITLAVMYPFLYGITISTGGKESIRKLLKSNSNNVWPLIGLFVVRAFLAVSFILAMLASHVNLAGWTILAIIAAVMILIYATKRTMKNYSVIESHFFANLNAKENEAKKLAPVTTSIMDKFKGYDVHIETIKVSVDSDFVGRKLKDVPFRAETGVNIVKIQRGTKSIVIPGGDEVIYPFDRILAAGTSDQIKAFRKMMADAVSSAEKKEVDFDVVASTIKEESYLNGKTLRDTNLRDYHVMIISVLRDDEFITNPKPDFMFRTGDTVWIAGEKDSCLWIGD